jgi:hypothetical protein
VGNSAQPSECKLARVKPKRPAHRPLLIARPRFESCRGRSSCRAKNGHDVDTAGMANVRPARSRPGWPKRRSALEPTGPGHDTRRVGFTVGQTRVEAPDAIFSGAPDGMFTVSRRPGWLVPYACSDAGSSSTPRTRATCSMFASRASSVAARRHATAAIMQSIMPRGVTPAARQRR